MYLKGIHTRTHAWPLTKTQKRATRTVVFVLHKTFWFKGTGIGVNIRIAVNKKLYFCTTYFFKIIQNLLMHCFNRHYKCHAFWYFKTWTASSLSWQRQRFGAVFQQGHHWRIKPQRFFSNWKSQTLAANNCVKYYNKFYHREKPQNMSSLARHRKIAGHYSLLKLYQFQTTLYVALKDS